MKSTKRKLRLLLKETVRSIIALVITMASILGMAYILGLIELLV